MLYRRDTDTITFDSGRKPCVAHTVESGWNLCNRIQIDPAKYNPGINRRRAKRQIDFLSRVQTDASCADNIL